MSVDDITLGAFADGELAPDEAARIEAEAARDPDLATRIQRLRDLRRALSGAYADALSEPPPERLLTAVGGAEPDAPVISLAEHRARRQARAAPALVRWAALAASLAIAFGAGHYLAALAQQTPIAEGRAGLVAQGELATGLERQLASTQGAQAPVTIGVSFKASDGRYCRTFLLRRGKPLAGLACRDPGGWQVAMAMQAQPEAGVEGGYRTAADETPAPILDQVDGMISGAPLDGAAEAKARDAGWGVRR